MKMDTYGLRKLLDTNLQIDITVVGIQKENGKTKDEKCLFWF